MTVAPARHGAGLQGRCAGAFAKVIQVVNSFSVSYCSCAGVTESLSPGKYSHALARAAPDQPVPAVSVDSGDTIPHPKFPVCSSDACSKK